MANPLDARERVQLCARFDELGPDAPTLCEGWTTADLAAHLVVRERNPVAAPGILLGERLPALGRLTEKAMAKEKARGWDELVERVRTGPPLGPFAVPGVRRLVNLNEYVIHHEDVRRANGFEVRDDVADLQDAVWPLLTRIAKVAFRGLPDGVGLELARPAGARRSTVRGGARTVVAQGEPIELLLWAYGRGDHADVAFTGNGTEADVAGVRAAHLSV